MMSFDSLLPLLSDPDSWVGVLISDPRAALRASRVLRGSGRHLDGPFLVRDGKAGRTPVTICVTDPGGAGAWFAGAKLLARRVSPTLLVGFTPVVRLSDEMPEADGAFAVETRELDALTPALRRIESTATDVPPPEALAMADGIVPVAHRSLAASTLGGCSPTDEKRIEKKARPGDTTSKERGVGAIRLGCWTGGTLQSRAAARWLRETYRVEGLDRESAGLGDAAGEHSIPWVVFGSFVSLDDPVAQARRPREGGSLFARESGFATPGLALSRFLEILATASG